MHPQANRKFETSLGYLRPCVKNQEGKKEVRLTKKKKKLSCSLTDQILQAYLKM